MKKLIAIIWHWSWFCPWLPAAATMLTLPLPMLPQQTLPLQKHPPLPLICLRTSLRTLPLTSLLQL